tara:strand:+ start:903 stop:2180 length:1278 start_codon:yes stop_codon:yes gene_type:complete
MEYWYKFFTYLFYPIASIYLFIRKIKKKEHKFRYKEKLSKINVSRGEGFLIWYHVASVGEAMSILPLIEKFEKDEKINRILITSITLSSAQILEKKYKQNKKIIHQFLPLDVPVYVKKFLNHWSPNLSIFIDSEIWPNLISEIKEKNIPLLLVNARITKKTFLRWKLFKQFSQKLFQSFDLCIVADKETEKHLNILGAKNIKSYGNLKFSGIKTVSEKKLKPVILNKIENRKIWCAASTHPSEEIFCAKTHLVLKNIYKNVLTVIIPRHIERSKKIRDELSKLKLKVVLYSEFNLIDPQTDILIVDAYGEAIKFYNLSKCVFLGKSLIKSMASDSGQNPIEPSRLGCKILHGPFVSNFTEVYEYLASLGVTNKILTPEELSKSITKIMENNNKKDDQIIQKIENYGLTTLNNVFNEIKIYIDRKA